MNKKLAVFLLARDLSFVLSATILEVWCLSSVTWPGGAIFGVVLPIVLGLGWACILSTSPAISASIYLRSIMYLVVSLLAALSLIDFQSIGLAVAHLVLASLIGFVLVLLD